MSGSAATRVVVDRCHVSRSTNLRWCRRRRRPTSRCAGTRSSSVVARSVHGLHRLIIIHRVPKKLSPLMFDENFGKCGPIFKILPPGDSWENSLCTYRKDFHLTYNVLLHYLVKVENLKMLPNFHVERDKCNLPQKYRTNDFTSVCVQHMKYSLERTKTVRR